MTLTKSGRKSSSSQSHIGCLVLHKVCGTRAKGMQTEFERHLKEHGPEWCCRRYKAIYTAAIHLKNGDRVAAQKLYQSNSIAYHKGTSFPKGAWGYAVEQFVNSSRPSVLRRWAAVLRMYTSLTLDSPSPAQVKKFTDAVCNEPNRPHEVYRQIGFDLAKRVCEDRGFRTHVDVNRLLASVKPSKLHGTSYYFSDLLQYSRSHLTKDGKLQLRDVLNQPYGKFLFSLLTENWIPASLSGLLPMDNVRQSKMRVHHLDSGFNGRVRMEQQQGCKGRTVFQPTANLQLAFLPLHELCNGISKRLFYFEADWDEQVDGVYAALENLLRGLPVYSVDQSSATDRFPRGISEGILDYFGATTYANALEEVCNRPWQCDFLRDPVTVKAGQPMGLYGSFPLYNLSNLMVAADAQIDASRMGQGLTTFSDGTCFKVVGDDIILSDARVAECYRSKLEDYGVEISETKSFSGKVAEFAGFLLLPTNKETTAFRPYKFPVGDQITNPVDFLHALGIQAASLSPKWAEHYLAYQRTLSQRKLDLSPMVLALNEASPIETHNVNKDANVVSLVQAISAVLCQSYDGMKAAGERNRQLAAYANSVYYGTSTRWTNEPKSEVTERVIFATGATPRADSRKYDVFSRSDYARKDNEDRQNGHHLAHKRLRDDFLIPYEESGDALKESAQALYNRLRSTDAKAKADARRKKALQLLETSEPVTFGSGDPSPSVLPRAHEDTDPLPKSESNEDPNLEDDSKNL